MRGESEGEIEGLRRSLGAAEREIELLRVMVREGDHRLKNSLQVVSGLAQVHARKAHGEALTALQHLATQIEAIAEVHDSLQLNHGEAVDLGVVLPRVCAALQRMSDGKQLTIVCEVQSLIAPAAIAQPLALAVNELLLNAIQHAFADLRPGTIRIGAHHEGAQIVVVVADDGDGLPECFSSKRAPGFGMRIIRTLIEKIGGSLKAETNGGARFTVTVPVDGQKR